MRSEQVRHRVVGQDDAPGVVGAQIEPDAVAHAQHRPVAPRGDLDLVHLVARVAGRHHVLAAVLRPLDGPARDNGGRRDQQVLGIARRLGAEATAHIGGDDANLVGRQTERRDEPLLDEVDDLGRVPRRQRFVARVPLGDHAARLDRHAHVALDLEALLHRDVGLGERRGGIAEAGLEEDGDVVAPLRVDDLRPRLGARDHLRDDGQRLVLDLDQLAAVFSERATGGQDHRHDLADEAHAVPRHGELGDLLHRDVHARREPRRNRAEKRQRLHEPLEIGEGEDVGDARQPARRLGLHGEDLGVTVRAPDEGRVEHPGQLDVVHVAAIAAQIARVLFPAD